MKRREEEGGGRGGKPYPQRIFAMRLGLFRERREEKDWLVFVSDCEIGGRGAFATDWSQ